MSFRKILDNLVERSGALGVVMVAEDGEVVDASVPTSATALNSTGTHLELDLIGAHYAVILDMCKSAAEVSRELGSVKTVMVNTSTVRLAVTVLKDGYMIVAIMDNGTLSGKVAYESRAAVEKIELEMG